jgi:hypothetical protein
MLLTTVTVLMAMVVISLDVCVKGNIASPSSERWIIAAHNAPRALRFQVHEAFNGINQGT